MGSIRSSRPRATLAEFAEEKSAEETEEFQEIVISQ